MTSARAAEPGRFVLRPSIHEMTVNVVCASLLLAIAVPAAWATEQWVGRQSHKVMDRMIWREPVESWNR